MEAQVPPERRGDPWFEDGNIILVADSNQAAFKVHRGVLSRHSELFQSMFEMPQPLSGVELEGCQVVEMHDPPQELSNLIKALYDGAVFHNRNIDDFFHLAGILRLASKYFISALRAQAIRHLVQTWSYTLEGHDGMVERAIESPLIENTSYPYVHPLHVLNLARETNVRIIIPSVVYFLSLYPLPDLFRGDHPKLLVEHSSRPSSQLMDVREYALMYQHRIETIHSFLKTLTLDRPCVQGLSPACGRAFAKLALRLSRSWGPRTGPLHYMSQALRELNEDANVCSLCRRSFRNDISSMRAEVWDKLPEVIGMPCWGHLRDIDLAPA